MTIDHNELFAQIFAQIPNDTKSAAAIDTCALTRGWMVQSIDTAIPRAILDALCRQVDVRKRISAFYLADFKRHDPESNAHPAVIAGVAAAMLATAQQLSGSPDDDGFALKCLNSALKAITLADPVPCAPQLRAWALELLDAHTERTTR